MQNKETIGMAGFWKSMGILVVLAVHAGCSLGALTYYGGMFYMHLFFAAGYTFRRKEGRVMALFSGKRQSVF